ncbi:hypothetical protein GOP47_0002059 [Adiantum capillus-veneris]|uniref:Uncharacterized protein n=1 Tax=Adiantum capillus-veneris TaxID=13818 RepID=A0A9D4ZQN1_ADICA|nr:hypothetical protein GOP47_0002059 [Adiantum capillus-veneris]
MYACYHSDFHGVRIEIAAFDLATTLLLSELRPVTAAHIGHGHAERDGIKANCELLSHTTIYTISIINTLWAAVLNLQFCFATIANEELIIFGSASQILSFGIF